MIGCLASEWVPPSRASIFKPAVLFPLRSGWSLIPSSSHWPGVFQALSICRLPAAASMSVYTYGSPATLLSRLPERTSSIIDLTMPTSGLTSYLWFFVIQREKLSSLAQSVSPVLSYTPTQKATFLSVPTRVTQVLTWTHFLPILGLCSGQFLLFSWLPTLLCQFLHHWAQALLRWEIPLIHP